MFTNVTIHDTIKLLKKKFTPIINYHLHVALLLNLEKESKYIFQSQFYKQTDGCTTDGPLSVTFSNIGLIKLERDQVKSLKVKFSRRFVDGVRSTRLKNMPDSLFDNLKNYKKKIKFTTETNPLKFLDTPLLLDNYIIKTKVYRKANNFSAHWESQIPKRH